MPNNAIFHSHAQSHSLTGAIIWINDTTKLILIKSTDHKALNICNHGSKCRIFHIHGHESGSIRMMVDALLTTTRTSALKQKHYRNRCQNMNIYTKESSIPGPSRQHLVQVPSNPCLIVETWVCIDIPTSLWKCTTTPLMCSNGVEC